MSAGSEQERPHIGTVTLPAVAERENIALGLIDRCYNPKSKVYKHYGGRGITVCEHWRNSFEAFLQDMGSKPPGRSIDRINNDGIYEPSNCRWATPKEQRR